ncbi:MAG TPA: NB-ARC domain-containing protein, partial [Allocoleopsis sp.]
MELEQGLELINQLVLDRTGSSLNAIEIAVLKGAWLGQSYETIAEATNYSASYISRTLSPQLWQLLSDTLGVSVTKKSFRACVERFVAQTTNAVSPPVQAIVPQAEESVATITQPVPVQSPIVPPADGAVSFAPPASAYCDWGEAIDVSIFYGRIQERETLSQWIVQEGCRLVTLLGMGGIGKTALSVKLAQEIQDNFAFVIWRSLRNAPPFVDLLKDLMLVLSRKQNLELPQTTEAQISHLLQYFQRYRCLLILDNGESILQSGAVGQYLPQYDGYGQLLRYFGETNHQSCLLFTSREKPEAIAVLEGEVALVRTLHMAGLSTTESEGIFSTKNL